MPPSSVLSPALVPLEPLTTIPKSLRDTVNILKLQLRRVFVDWSIVRFSALLMAVTVPFRGKKHCRPCCSMLLDHNCSNILVVMTRAILVAGGRQQGTGG